MPNMNNAFLNTCCVLGNCYGRLLDSRSFTEYKMLKLILLEAKLERSRL